jgi:hypothetical protein
MIVVLAKSLSPTYESVLEEMSDFQLWLDQPVWFTDDTKVLRREYIPTFAEYLTSVMKGLGFTMSQEWGKGHKVVARWMYIIMRTALNYDKPVIYPEPFHRDWPEDLDEFQHLFTHEQAAKIIEQWKLCEDFDLDTRVGQRYLHELQHLLYPYIDMDASKAGIRVAIALEDSESDSDSWKSGRGRSRSRMRGKDIYLEEAQEGYHGGKGFKV